MKATIYDFHGIHIQESDLCIVGTGAAGLELARHFDNTPFSITLLEGGLENFDWQIQKLCRFKQVGRKIRSADYSKPFDIIEAQTKVPRLRQYGGTLNIWSGKWKILNPYDLMQKPGIKETGWPIAYEEIYRYYRYIAEDYDLKGLLEMEGYIPPGIISNYAKENLSFSYSYFENPPTNIKEKFDKQIQHSSNTLLILGANVVNILLTEDLKHVDHLIIKSFDGLEQRVKSKYYVLACGTIENARLLLCSNKQVNTGIGNKNDLVGRNLIDHPKGVGGFIFGYPNQDKISILNLQMQLGKKLYPIEIGLKRELLQKLGLPNHSIFIFPPISSSLSHTHPFYFYLEQLPNLQSRLVLSEERDELNLPIPCLDWRFREEDKLHFKSFVTKIKDILAISGIGDLSFDESIFAMDFLSDASHQMGTTRMALKSEDGVVDVNCKVFGIENLFISGSSVFPTGGNANPTFTILALTRRLAEYLKDRMRMK